MKSTAAGIVLSAMVTPALAADFTPEQSYPSPLNVAASFDAHAGYTFLTNIEGDLNPNDLDTDYVTGGLNGRIGIPFGVLGAQLDVEAEATGAQDGSNVQYKNHFLGAAHLFWRDPTHGLIGAFGGIGRGNATLDGHVSFWFAGLEGQLYRDMFTLYGQAGFFDSTGFGNAEDGDGFHDFWFVRGVGRYFMSDTTMLQVELSYGRGQQDTVNYTAEIWGWGAKVEHALWSWPVTGFLAYEGSYYDNHGAGGPGNDDGQFAEHVLLAGISVRLGHTGAKINDRYGTSLDVPNIGRWATQGLTTD
jgi:hypothetical protein